MCFARSSWPARISFRSALNCLIIIFSVLFNHDSHFWHQFVTYWGFYSRWMFISIRKLNKLQLNAVSNSPNTAQKSIVGLSVHLQARTAPQRIVRH
jgi:hypothetical protein